jgi:hypothetical protein
MNNFIDGVAELCWIGIFISPLITIPLAWQIKKLPKAARIIIGILSAIILSTLSYYFWLSILFKSYGSFE